MSKKELNELRETLLQAAKTIAGTAEELKQVQEKMSKMVDGLIDANAAMKVDRVAANEAVQSRSSLGNK